MLKTALNKRFTVIFLLHILTVYIGDQSLEMFLLFMTSSCLFCLGYEFITLVRLYGMLDYYLLLLLKLLTFESSWRF